MNYPLTVLIVEDHWTVRKSMHEYLEENLITVHQADSHNDALSQFAEIGDTVDVAVIDIVLPLESGGRANSRQSLGVVDSVPVTRSEAQYRYRILFLIRGPAR